MPEYVITQSETLDLGRKLYANHAHLTQAIQLIENIGIAKRHLIRPIEETLRHTGFFHRNQIFEQEAKKRVPQVIYEALGIAGLGVRDVNAIVFVSCTGFMMPSLTAWLINELGFRSDTTQLPIAQLGCAAGSAAINRAQDYCRAHPGSNVLVIACEFCSLTYQPDDLAVGNLLSNGLFGDAVSAAVIRGDGNSAGMRLQAQRSYIIPNTTSWISYEVKETGFHFRLNKGLTGALRKSMPVLSDFVRDQGYDLPGLDFFVVHAGGPRVVDALRDPGGVPQQALLPSLETLGAYGNIASVSVFDVFRRIAVAAPKHGHVGLIAGFGPGITMELTLGTWTNGTGS